MFSCMCCSESVPEKVQREFADASASDVEKPRRSPPPPATAPAPTLVAELSEQPQAPASADARCSDLQSRIDALSADGGGIVFETGEGLESSLTESGRLVAETVGELLRERPGACVKVLGFCGECKGTKWDEPGLDVKLSLSRARATRAVMDGVGCRNLVAAKGMGFSAEKGPRCELVVTTEQDVQEIMEANFEKSKEENPESALQMSLDLITAHGMAIHFGVAEPELTEVGRRTVLDAAEVIVRHPDICLKVVVTCESCAGSPWEGPGQDAKLALVRARGVREVLQQAGCRNQVAAHGLGSTTTSEPSCILAVCSTEEAKALEAAAANTLDSDPSVAIQKELDRIIRKGMPFKGEDATLTAMGRQTAIEIAAVLKRSPAVGVRIHGYCGSCKGTKWAGPGEDKTLTLKRATSVQDALRAAGAENSINVQGLGHVDEHGPRCAILVEQDSAMPTAGSVGLELLFSTQDGVEAKKTFVRRPLGLDMTKELPLIVTSVKGHGAEVGVEVGWQLDAVAGEPIAKGRSFEQALDRFQAVVAGLPEA